MSWSTARSEFTVCRGRREETTMKRSTLGFLIIIALGILSGPLAADAQRAARVPRIGFLGLGSADSQRGQYLRDAFRQGLRELGWVEE